MRCTLDELVGTVGAWHTDLLYSRDLLFAVGTD